jgi:hypothetical protein
MRAHLMGPSRSAFDGLVEAPTSQQPRQSVNPVAPGGSTDHMSEEKVVPKMGLWRTKIR